MRLILACLLVLAPALARAHEVPWIHYARLGHEVIVETSSDAIDPTTPFAIASLGKAMTAVAVLRHVARGELSLDEAVRDLRPDLPPLDGLEGVTVEHLLTMTSGLAEYYWDDYVEAALADPGRVQTPLVALHHALEEPRAFDPGEGFAYSNTNYVILGLVLEAVAGRSYAEVIEDEVFGPAQMLDSVVMGAAPLPESFPRGHEGRLNHMRDYYAGQGFGDGGILASARDVAAFYTALFGTERLLSAPMRARMLADPMGQGYGMGIALGGDLVGHAGADLGFVSDVVMNLESGDIALALVGSRDGDTSWAFNVLALR